MQFNRIYTSFVYPRTSARGTVLKYNLAVELKYGNDLRQHHVSILGIQVFYTIFYTKSCFNAKIANFNRTKKG